MKIIEQRFLRGPNIHAGTPCMLTIVDLEEFDGVPAPIVPGFAERHDRAQGPAGLLKSLTLDLQRRAGSEVGFACTHPLDEAPRQHVIVCAYSAERVARRAFGIAMELMRWAAHGTPYEPEAEIDDLKRLGARCAIGTSTGAVVSAAQRRDIPTLRLTDDANLFQLGWGSKQHRLQATITGATGHIGVGIAGDKQLTKLLLQQAGLPVPAGESVTSIEDACRVAQQLGAPVTIKPLDANQGKGVTTICTTAADIAAAFEHARQYSRHVIVERYLCGRDYRVLVTGGKVAAASWRRPPCVRGDGVSTIRALVELENRNPARGAGHTNILTRILLDEHALALLRQQGYDVDSVLAAGVPVHLRGNANLSTGGTAEDVTDLLPPETAQLCIRAARIIGLDIAGIDIVCEDIALPLPLQGGGIIEVNAAPGIRMHEFPSRGQARNAGDAIVESLFGTDDGRIPVIALCGPDGSSGASTAARLIAHAAQLSGLRTGLATSDGVYIDSLLATRADGTSFKAARMLLADPAVEMAVLDTAAGGVLQDGLAFDRCDVTVILAVAPQQPQVSALLARAASGALVLNAADAACVALAEQLEYQREVVYFSMDADSPTLLRHIAGGGRAVYLHDHLLVLANGIRHQWLLDVRSMPASLQGAARDHGAAAAAAAALIAVGMPVEQAVAGLQSFMTASDLGSASAAMGAGARSGHI